MRKQDFFSGQLYWFFESQKVTSRCEPILFIFVFTSCEHASKTHVKNVNKTKTIYLNKNILRTFVDTDAHIPNMHRATCYHMLCIFYVNFGAFSMVNLALKCTKK